MVRDEQAAAARRDVLDALGLHAEILLVEEVEERLDLLLVDGVEAEVVDLLAPVPHAEAAPLAEIEVRREELARGVEDGGLAFGGERAARRRRVRRARGGVVRLGGVVNHLVEALLELADARRDLGRRVRARGARCAVDTRGRRRGRGRDPRRRRQVGLALGLRVDVDDVGAGALARVFPSRGRDDRARLLAQADFGSPPWGAFGAIAPTPGRFPAGEGVSRGSPSSREGVSNDGSVGRAVACVPASIEGVRSFSAAAAASAIARLTASLECVGSASRGVGGLAFFVGFFFFDVIPSSPARGARRGGAARSCSR